MINGSYALSDYAPSINIVKFPRTPDFIINPPFFFFFWFLLLLNLFVCLFFFKVLIGKNTFLFEHRVDMYKKKEYSLILCGTAVCYDEF